MERFKKLTKHSVFSAIIFCFMLFCPTKHLLAQNFSFPTNQKRDALSFQLVKNLIIIPVYLNEKGPFNFILDTGIGATLVTDTTLKNLLNPKGLKRIKINGYGDGNNIEAKISNFVVANIGDAQSEAMPTIFIDEDPFDLSSYLGVKVAGLIGYSFFKSFIVSISYTNKRLVFSIPFSKQPLKGDKIPLEFIDNKPYVNVAIEDATLGKVGAKMIVDCGAGHALSFEKRNEKPWPVPPIHIDGNLGVGIGGEISGKIARTEILTFGKFKFKNILTNYPSLGENINSVYPKQRNGNLGAAILRRFNIIYDYNHGYMYLKKNLFFSQPFDHDMAGMEIIAGEKGGYFISRIEPNSPAQKAGFLAHDQIIGVNFKNIDNYTLESIENLFKSNDGASVIVEIAREDEIMMLLIKLKKRI
jgi:hypothetical protein